MTSLPARVYGELSLATERAAEESVGLLDVAEALARVVDERDASDAHHSRWVARLCREIALELGCGEHAAETVAIAGRLHDIGKVIVPDEILDRPGPLTPSEWRLMRRHPATGAEIVAQVAALRDTIPLIRGHHERFDGTGYPERLVGSAIPLGARIIAAADAYCAMTSDRPYRLRRSGREAELELCRCAGSHFDPAVVAGLRRVMFQADRELMAA